MQFSTIFALFAAAAVSAMPHNYWEPSAEKSSGSSSTTKTSNSVTDNSRTANDNNNTESVCGSGNALSCCDSSSRGDASGSLLGLGNILGGACALPVDGATCSGSGNTYCCPTDQTGVINVGASCTPVDPTTLLAGIV